MTLSELKTPYETLVKLNKDKLDKCSCNDAVKLYLSSYSVIDRNVYISYLICESWNLLQRIYYQNNNANLSCEECYDIFIQTLDYVINNHVWDKEDSSLYNDKDGFMKAMAVTIQCRKKNYIESKFKQKRIANTNIISLDSLNEDYSEGYFTQFYENIDYDLNENVIKDKIRYYFVNRCYMTSFILEAILYNNIYDEHNNLDFRKLRKYLRNISSTFCRCFANKYNVDFDEANNSAKEFRYLSQVNLDKKIKTSFTTLKYDNTIKQILAI